jgi:hypothetical protein
MSFVRVEVVASINNVTAGDERIPGEEQSG